MLPTLGTELEWEHFYCCLWALNAAAGCGTSLPGYTLSDLKVDHLYLCLSSGSPINMWSHGWHIVNTQQMSTGCVGFYILQNWSEFTFSRSHSFTCFLFKKIYLFIFGCVGSLLLQAFSICGEGGLLFLVLNGLTILVALTGSWAWIC